MENSDDFMAKIVALCKRRGFIFQSSEMYGGINGFWDYGPIGVALKRAVEQTWWKYMVEDRDNVEGLDSTIICHPMVWQASGHLANFADEMTDCTVCKKRFRVDQMEDPTTCPACGAKAMTPPRNFNLMMKTFVGPVFDEEHAAYLRAETCQPIFVDFNTIRIASRQKLPFGIAQTGKSFRNEINPRNFTFRSREFTQMEMEFFCHEDESMKWFDYWHEQRWNFYTQILGIPEDKLRIHWHDKLAHYAKKALDIEFLYPFGWNEVEGVHHRGTWDMSQHAAYSKQEQDCRYFDQERNATYYPTVVETSCGLDRICLLLICNAYDEDTAATQKEGMDEDARVVLHFAPRIAPVQVAVLPLSKKLEEPATDLFRKIRGSFRAQYDVTGSIGKRYRRQDEIGTPFCVTFDFDSLNDNAVTVRDRDAMTQERVPVAELAQWLRNKIDK